MLDSTIALPAFVSCFSFSVLFASSASQWAAPDRALHRSGQRRASSESSIGVGSASTGISRCEWAVPGLNGTSGERVDSAGGQKACLKECQKICKKYARKSACQKVHEKECQEECQKAGQRIDVKECLKRRERPQQKICQKIYQKNAKKYARKIQKECRKICQIY